MTADARRLFVDGRETTPRSYQGRLDAVVYATDRLRVVHGPMRERRQFLDRSASALWPAYRQILREYERVVRQRNAALDAGGPGLEPWDEALAISGARLRIRRGDYVARLAQALAKRLPGRRRNLRRRDRPSAARRARPPGPTRCAGRSRLAVATSVGRAAASSGPHRDAITFSIDGVDASASASAGQARSLLLALTLATLEVYRAERGPGPAGPARRPRFGARRSARRRALPRDRRPGASSRDHGPQRLGQPGGVRGANLPCGRRPLCRGLK